MQASERLNSKRGNAKLETIVGSGSIPCTLRACWACRLSVQSTYFPGERQCLESAKCSRQIQMCYNGTAVAFHCTDGACISTIHGTFHDRCKAFRSFVFESISKWFNTNRERVPQRSMFIEASNMVIESNAVQWTEKACPDLQFELSVIGLKRRQCQAKATRRRHSQSLMTTSSENTADWKKTTAHLLRRRHPRESLLRKLRPGHDVRMTPPALGLAHGRQQLPNPG